VSGVTGTPETSAAPRTALLEAAESLDRAANELDGIGRGQLFAEAAEQERAAAGPDTPSRPAAPETGRLSPRDVVALSDGTFAGGDRCSSPAARVTLCLSPERARREGLVPSSRARLERYTCRSARGFSVGMKSR